jgi:hypothetical protein
VKKEDIPMAEESIALPVTLAAATIRHTKLVAIPEETLNRLHNVLASARALTLAWEAPLTPTRDLTPAMKQVQKVVAAVSDLVI